MAKDPGPEIPEQRKAGETGTHPPTGGSGGAHSRGGCLIQLGVPAVLGATLFLRTFLRRE